MKIKITAIVQFLVPALMVLLVHHKLYSQEEDSIAIKRPGFFIGLTAGIGQSNIYNEGLLSVSGLVSGKKNSFTGSLDFGYFFTRSFGISTAFSYGSYQGQLALDSYQNIFNTRDSEGEPYERQVSGKNITEDQKIGLLGIPVCLNFRLPAGKNFGLFLQAGINTAFPVTKNYSGNGTFTYKGYYPAYNVLLENLPAYGFPSDAKVHSEGMLEIKPVSFEAIASAGFDILIREKFRLLMAATYNQSLSNIAEYTNPGNFQLSTEADHLYSMMGGSSKATVQSVGLKISLRYFLSHH